MPQCYSDSRGTLIPFDLKDLTFECKRIFIADVHSEQTERGGHAHHVTEQFAICLEGKIDMYLTTKDGKQSVIQLEKGDSVHIPNMVWDKQVYKTDDSKLLVMCSTEYNVDDYIVDYNKFTSTNGVNN